MGMTCQHCKHWLATEELHGAKRECHRYPPVPGFIDGEQRTFYPHTTADQTCGEFEQRPPQEITEGPPQVRGNDDTLFEASTHERIERGECDG